ncbi:unnamed protein product [Closterium sp. NIES-54]
MIPSPPFPASAIPAGSVGAAQAYSNNGSAEGSPSSASWQWDPIGFWDDPPAPLLHPPLSSSLAAFPSSGPAAPPLASESAPSFSSGMPSAAAAAATFTPPAFPAPAPASMPSFEGNLPSPLLTPQISGFGGQSLHVEPMPFPGSNASAAAPTAAFAAASAPAGGGSGGYSALLSDMSFLDSVPGPGGGAGFGLMAGAAAVDPGACCIGAGGTADSEGCMMGVAQHQQSQQQQQQYPVFQQQQILQEGSAAAGITTDSTAAPVTEPAVPCPVPNAVQGGGACSMAAFGSMDSFSGEARVVARFSQLCNEDADAAAAAASGGSAGVCGMEVAEADMRGEGEAQQAQLPEILPPQPQQAWRVSVQGQAQLLGQPQMQGHVQLQEQGLKVQAAAVGQYQQEAVQAAPSGEWQRGASQRALYDAANDAGRPSPMPAAAAVPAPPSAAPAAAPAAVDGGAAAAGVGGSERTVGSASAADACARCKCQVGEAGGVGGGGEVGGGGGGGGAAGGEGGAAGGEGGATAGDNQNRPKLSLAERLAAALGEEFGADTVEKEEPAKPDEDAGKKGRGRGRGRKRERSKPIATTAGPRAGFWTALGVVEQDGRGRQGKRSAEESASGWSGGGLGEEWKGVVGRVGVSTGGGSGSTGVAGVAGARGATGTGGMTGIPHGENVMGGGERGAVGCGGVCGSNEVKVAKQEEAILGGGVGIKQGEVQGRGGGVGKAGGLGNDLSFPSYSGNLSSDLNHSHSPLPTSELPQSMLYGGVILTEGVEEDPGGRQGEGSGKERRSSSGSSSGGSSMGNHKEGVDHGLGDASAAHLPASTLGITPTAPAAAPAATSAAATCAITESGAHRSQGAEKRVEGGTNRAQGEIIATVTATATATATAVGAFGSAAGVSFQGQGARGGTGKAGSKSQAMEHPLLARIWQLAELVATAEDEVAIRRKCEELLPLVSARGSAEQRVAQYFLEGLMARINGDGALHWNSPDVPPHDDFMRAMSDISACMPHHHFLLSACNAALLSAISPTDTVVHVVDFGWWIGAQWPDFIASLAARPGPKPLLRYTKIESPASQCPWRVLPRVPLADCKAILTRAAANAGIRLDFAVVECSLESIDSHISQHRPPLSSASTSTAAAIVAGVGSSGAAGGAGGADGAVVPWSMVRSSTEDSLGSRSSSDPGQGDAAAAGTEALLVHGIMRLHLLPGGSVVRHSPRDAALRALRRLSPRVAVLGERHVDHDGPFFLRRLGEALPFYLSVFESMEAGLAPPRLHSSRDFIEKAIIGRDIVNVVACEGSLRVVRSEPLGKWMSRMREASFAALPFSAHARHKVAAAMSQFPREFGVQEQDDGGLLMTFKGQPILAVGMWRIAC